VAILGPSGCGKSTTLNVIAGLLKEKEAEISGEIIWYKEKNKPIIRMVFQEATLLPWRSVEKNIAFGLEIQKLSKEEIARKVQEMIQVVGLSDFAKSYPHQLSIGMQQRVNFARALVCEPDLLLLDEPFSALDNETKKIIQKEFSRILKEKNITSIFVTHNIEEVIAMATMAVVLSKGPSTVLRVVDLNRESLTIESMSKS
jgi:NitT/TauT family transport system ATP-binding protein